MKKFLYHGKKNICGDRIRMARLEKRLSQTDLARLLQLEGVPMERDVISRMEMGYHHLKWEDRLKIEGALKTGGKPAEIAEMLGVCVKTIYNEIKRGLCLQQKEGYIFQEEYCAEVAERKYQDNLRAKGPEIKLGRDHAFANFVERKIIEEHYSPGAVLAYIEAAGLEIETHICETTLYSYIYRGGRVPGTDGGTPAL